MVVHSEIVCGAVDVSFVYSGPCVDPSGFARCCSFVNGDVTRFGGPFFFVRASSGERQSSMENVPEVQWRHSWNCICTTKQHS